jgi:hypothetical protein
MTEKMVIFIVYAKLFYQNEFLSHSNLFHNCYNRSTKNYIAWCNFCISWNVETEENFLKPQQAKKRLVLFLFMKQTNNNQNPFTLHLLV